MKEKQNLEFKTGFEISKEIEFVKRCPCCGQPVNNENLAEIYFCDAL